MERLTILWYWIRNCVFIKPYIGKGRHVTIVRTGDVFDIIENKHEFIVRLTPNIDYDGFIIQTVINKKIVNSTILSIEHLLHYIRDKENERINRGY